MWNLKDMVSTDLYLNFIWGKRLSSAAECRRLKFWKGLRNTLEQNFEFQIEEMARKVIVSNFFNIFRNDGRRNLA